MTGEEAGPVQSPKRTRSPLWWDAPSLMHTPQAGDGTLPFASPVDGTRPLSQAGCTVPGSASLGDRDMYTRKH